MTYQRQKYNDLDLPTVLGSNYNIVQIKYDGWWCRLEVLPNGDFTMFSRTGEVLKSGTTDSRLHGVYIGEYLFGTQWAKKHPRYGHLFLFDICEFQGAVYTNLSYKHKYTTLLKLKRGFAFPDWIYIVPCYPMVDAESLWTHSVVKDGAEGLIFRHSESIWKDPVARVKQRIEDTYTITDYKEGQGRLAGTLGALICIAPCGLSCEVGGGFTDDLRNEIWFNRPAYLNRKIKVAGKLRFDSGLIRHPNFIGFSDA